LNALKNLALGSLLAVFAIAAQAKGLTPDQVRQKIHDARPDIPINQVAESKTIKGFYEVTLPDSTVLFVNADATHFIVGDLFRIEKDGFVNVTEEKRNTVRKDLIDGVDPAEMVVFAPQGEKKASITVFTDIDCGYCRKLHQEVPELNRMGIEVRYLAYPRSGINTPSYDKFVWAWCAENQQQALTRAKSGEDIEHVTCDNPVAAQYMLGGEVGVTGTPAIVFEDGRLQPGYLPAARMAERLGLVN